MNWTLCNKENNKINHMYLKSNARNGHKMDLWRELKLQDRERNSPERSRHLHKTVMLLPKKRHLGAQFMTFRSTTVMLQVMGSFPAPSRCIKCVKSMNIFAYILHNWNWAPTSKLDTSLTAWSMRQSGGSHRSTWHAWERPCPVDVQLGLVRTDVPRWSFAVGPTTPHRWGRGRRVQTWDSRLCLPHVWWQTC